MTQIKNWPTKSYDPTYYLPIQKSDGTTGKILISDVGGAGLAVWQLKTTNYTAIAGDRLRIDASAGNVVITLPSTPNSIAADIWLQRLDTSTNKVLIRTGTNNINGQSGKDGVFAPLVPQLIERLSYVNPLLGWLGQYDRLTYQAVSFVPTSILLLLNFEGANNSTVFVDSSSFSRSISAFGNAMLTTTSPISGTSSGTFDGSGSYLKVPYSADFDFGNSNFSISMQTLAIPTTGYQALIGRRMLNIFTAGSWVIYTNQGVVEVWLSDFNNSGPFLVATGTNINDGLPHKIDWMRVGNNWTLSIDNVVIASATAAITIFSGFHDIYIAHDINSPIYDYPGLIDNLSISN
jgi:hypothetical protein